MIRELGNIQGAPDRLLPPKDEDDEVVVITAGGLRHEKDIVGVYIDVERGPTCFACLLQIPRHHHTGTHSSTLPLEEGRRIPTFSRHPCLVQQWTIVHLLLIAEAPRVMRVLLARSTLYREMSILYHLYSFVFFITYQSNCITKVREIRVRTGPI